MSASSGPLQDAIKKLVKQEPGWKAFDKKPAVGARPGTIGTGRPAAAGDVGAGSFVEVDYAQREYYAERSVVSTDGVFSIVYKPAKKLRGENGMTLELKEPPAV